MSPNRPHSLQASSLVRLVSSVVAVSLVAAAGVVVIESQGQIRPLFQIPAAALTLGAGALAIYAGSLAVSGRRAAAQLWWIVCIVALVLLPTLQVLPIIYDTTALLDLKALAPPLWPYAVAVPLLLFLILETSIPSQRSDKTSNLFLFLGLFSAVIFLFFATALVGHIANRSILMLVPHRLFLSVLTPVGIGGLIVLGTVLVRKGFAKEGIALLLVIGFGVEWMSTWSYDGPHFIEEASYTPYSRFPLLPVLAGTIPGILTAIAGLVAGWEVYIRGYEEDEEEEDAQAPTLDLAQAG